jgi:hypothetical protein
MNLHTALTKSVELHDDPRAFAGKLLADQRQIIETLKLMLESDDAWMLQFDLQDWDCEANDLSDLCAEMFRRYGG